MSFDLLIRNGDLLLQGGDFQTVQDGEKLRQDILKICLTTAGSNPLQPWYGSYISRSLIGSPLATSIVLQVGQSQLQNAIENLRSLQAAQVKSFQQVTPDEQIGAIQDISIVRDATDPTVFTVSVKVMSKGFKPIIATFGVSPI
jgi:phage baseplate assembly protein W